MGRLVRRLVRQLRRRVILHHERSVDEKPLLWRSRRAEAAADERAEARGERGVEPAPRPRQRVDVRVSVGVSHSKAR